MNSLLLNRDGFVMPADGWYQVAPLGEFAHAATGVVQVVDAEACAAMVNRFASEAVTDNFAGLLVDFDHFSLDGEKRSEAAGWITALENREGGLFAQIRWSDLGEEAVRGGRYRFLSPVWSRSDCQDLGNGRVRPVRLLNAAVTNDPNLKGMRPLSNSAAGAGNEECGVRNAESGEGEKIANAGGSARFKWVLSGDGKHCPSCAAVAGQVHTMAEWDAAGIRPGGGALYCLGKCKCRLVATNEASGGAVTGVVKRHRPVVANAERGARNAECREGSLTENTEFTEVGEAIKTAKRAVRAGMMANQGWTRLRRTASARHADEALGNSWSDEARAASLAVRRAKAEAREKLLSGTEKKRGRAYTRPELGRLFQDVGYDAMTPGQIDNYVEFIRQRMKDDVAGPDATERAFLRVHSDANPVMTDREDSIQQWCIEFRRLDRAILARTGMRAQPAADRYQALMDVWLYQPQLPWKQEDADFGRNYAAALARYKADRRKRLRDKVDKEWMEMLPFDAAMKYKAKIDSAKAADALAEKQLKDWRSGKMSTEKLLRKGDLENRWSDTARAASLAVRKAKALARGQRSGGQAVGRSDGEKEKGRHPGNMDRYLGGDPYFDEVTGKRVLPGAPKKGAKKVSTPGVEYSGQYFKGKGRAMSRLEWAIRRDKEAERARRRR